MVLFSLISKITRGLRLLTNVEEKFAYPYITEFKKEPYKSFSLISSKNIKSFYLKDYDKIKDLISSLKEIIFLDSRFTIEDLYWYLLMKKYLRERLDDSREVIYEFVKNCEVEYLERVQVGFKSSPNSNESPDIWSTYYAISCLYLSGNLKEYKLTKLSDNWQQKLKNFVNAHKKNDKYLHCLEKECQKKHQYSETLFFVFEILTLIGVDVRIYREQYRNIAKDLKKDSNISTKLLCLKYLDLDSEIKDKDLEFLHQSQKDNGGFSLEENEGQINETFWTVNVLDAYAWILDYNPVGIYSFISKKLSELILDPIESLSSRIPEFSKLLITLCVIWKKFIENIERLIFNQLEKQKYVDVKQLENSFGLAHGIEEIILYLNLSYIFNLKIVDNDTEFQIFLSRLGEREKLYMREFYKQIHNNSIVSLSDIYKKMKRKNENLKLREDIIPIIINLIKSNFFKGNIRTKRGFTLKTKFYFYLDFILDKIIISDTIINTEKIYEEKLKLEDIKNDIFNMTLELSNTIKKVKEEIESYLMIDEIDYARQRLKYLIRDSLMEADFLNENIENSFNENLSYINLQASLNNEISTWNKLYSALQRRLAETENYLLEKINAKEELRNFQLILDELDVKIYELQENINKNLITFGNDIINLFETSYNESKFELITKNLNKISQKVSSYDQTIYKVSQQITSKDKKITRKHKAIIDNWLKIKSDFDTSFNYYASGFQFFNESKDKIALISQNIKNEIKDIREQTKTLIDDNKFQRASELIKVLSAQLFVKERKQIKDINANIKTEIKKRQKLFTLYHHLEEMIEKVDENLLEVIAQEGQMLQKNVIEERNRAKMEELDNFIAKNVQSFKDRVADFEISLNQSKKRRIDDVIANFDNLVSDFDEIDKKFSKKIKNLENLIDGFDEKSINIIQWEKFKESYLNDVNEIREKNINQIITEEISVLTKETKSDKISLKELSERLDLKCKYVIPRIRDLIEVSKLQAELVEEKKQIIVFTEDYYRFKELSNYVEKKLLKNVQESVGKFLALHDSCIKKRTLRTNLLEIQNRISDFSGFDSRIMDEFNIRIEHLSIDSERIEIKELKKQLYNKLKLNKETIEEIKISLLLFLELVEFIEKEFFSLENSLTKSFQKFLEESGKPDTYQKLLESFKVKKEKVDQLSANIEEKIEEALRAKFNKTKEIQKFETEIREYYVKKKYDYNRTYEKLVKQINNKIETLKFETYSSELLEGINKNKVHLSQLLGTLQSRVEDYIETEQFKKAYVKIKKREKDIEVSIKETNKEINNAIREFNKISNNFETKNKHLIKDFEQFIKEFKDIVTEKVKSSEEQILRAYVQMAIKAMASKMLTVSFLQSELKIKKQKIQKHLISLISSEKLNGVYDPRLGIYYEDPNTLEHLDEKELEVMNKMNFKLQRIISRMKIFVGQYGRILSFFASLFAISYYIFMMTGQNPTIFIIALVVAFILITYLLFKKKKEEKIP